MRFEFNPADEARDQHGECRHEIQTLQLELEKFRAVAVRVRQVANIVCKPHMSYSGARYEQQFDELLAGEPGDAGKALLEELRELRLEKMKRDGLPTVSGEQVR